MQTISRISLAGAGAMILAVSGCNLMSSSTSGSGTFCLNNCPTTQPQAQPAINYNGSPFSFTRGVSISTLTPTNTGGAISSCTISPNLTTDTGLTFNTSTCAISGMPTTDETSTLYTITATNSGGNATAQVHIAVSDPAPLVLATMNTANPNSNPYRIVANATTVYFTTNNEIFQVPVGSNNVTPSNFAPVTSANGDSGSYGMALDGTNLYFTDYGQGYLDRVLLASPFTLTPIATFGYSTYYAQAVAVGGGNVYWGGYASGTVSKTPPSGPTITSIFNAGSTYNSISLATDANNVYWTSLPNPGYNPANTGGVYQQTLAANGPAGTINLAHNLAGPTSVTATANYVYWTDGITNAVMTVPIGSSGMTPVALAPSETGASSIVSDGGAIYWVDVLQQSSPGSSTIRTCSVSPSGGCGPITTLATVNDYVPALAINGPNLYWVGYYGGQVVQLVK